MLLPPGVCVALFLSFVDRAAGKEAASDYFRAVGTCIGTFGEREGRKHERQCEGVQK